jgi:hypothetical protein
MRGTESLTNNNNIKKTVKNKALHGNPSQTPPARLDCEGLRQCHRFQQYFIYT